MIHNNRLKLWSLNCNSLRKTHSVAARSSLMRYLRQQQPHLLSLQETHAINTTTEHAFHQQLLAHSSLWTWYCGLISSSLDITLTHTQIDLGDFRERIILAHATSTISSFQDFHILVIYAPATSSIRVCWSFFHALLQSSVFSLSADFMERLIISGDFDYNCYNSAERHLSSIARGRFAVLL